MFVRRGVEEGKCAVEIRRPELLVAPVGEGKRDDGEACDVVDAVAAVASGDDPVCVLNDPDVVDERPQVVRAQAREVEVGDSRRAAARRECARLLKDGRGGLRDRRPAEGRADTPSFRPGVGEPVGLVDVVAYRFRQRP